MFSDSFEYRKFNKKTFIKRLCMVLAIFLAMDLFSKTAIRADAKTEQYTQTVSPYDDSDTKERLDEAEKEKEEKQAELEAAQLQLQQTQDSLVALENQRGTYEGELYALNLELQEVADTLAVIEAELEIKRLEVEETQRALDESIELCNQQYEEMVQRIRFMYESSDMAYMELLLSAKSIGEFLNYADYITALEEYDRQMLISYQETVAAISENKALLEQELADIEALEASAIAEQERITDLINNTSQYLATTAASIEGVEALAAAYEENCNEKQREKEEAEATYEAIKAEYEEELRLSQLAATSSWRDISQIVFEEGDRYLLANLIYCEAGGEPFEGQVAVGAVVINRLLSSRYPDTVTGVIYQYKQFAPVLDGHLALALAENRATESCYAAADAAMSGTTNVGTCVYFRTPIEGLTGLQIGGHIFY